MNRRMDKELCYIYTMVYTRSDNKVCEFSTVCLHGGNVLYIQNSSIRKREILPFATTWMALEGITLEETSQTQRDKCCLASLICRIKTNEQAQFNINRGKK